MNYKVIACNVFKREIEWLAPRSPHRLEIEFFELGEHAHPARLREKLQQKIDEADDFDAVLLGYGLCGRATDALRAGKKPLVLARSHDCCGILLGSRRRFEELFREMPSTPFSSIGFCEHGEYYFADGEMLLGDGYEKLVEQYGEDNAKYVYEMLHPRLDGKLQPILFISHPELDAAAAAAECRTRAAAEGREYRETVGDLRLLRMLLDGEWNEEEFLRVPPGAMIRQVGDWDRILEFRA